jgi:deoxyribodipyrimidine photo-lyase
MERIEKLLAEHPRLRPLHTGLPNTSGSCVVYWMQRAQRGIDNPALNLAIALGNELEQPVVVVFGLTADYPGAQRRHYRFLVEGLVDVQTDLESRGARLVVRQGEPPQVVAKLVRELNASILIGDENPLHVGLAWRTSLAEALTIPFYLVDADVVVPSSLFDREEYAARTLRPKIHRVWDAYLQPARDLRARCPWTGSRPKGLEIDPDGLLRTLKVGGVAEVPGYRGGAREAERRLDRFIDERLPRYAEERNQPTPYQTSELSAHLHFGHISPLRIARRVLDSGVPQFDIDTFLEELIVRRELAINYVARNPNYDSLLGCPEWARKTLEKHRLDARPILYNPAELEAGETHDPLWNAAQKEMVLTGRMHNYLRMYWAKKILEWTRDAEEAFAVAVELNDRYEMDGRDPNGYAGIAWAIGGKHDRPWPERPIFGTVRFMSFESTRKKFNSRAYIDRVAAIEAGSIRPGDG